MKKDTILVIGACGQIGIELTLALKKEFGADSVIAADVKAEPDALRNSGYFLPLDVLDRQTLLVIVKRYRVTQIYLLAAMLSATGEAEPHRAWHLNMQGLINVLEVAREEKIEKIFWPSSIAVFGPSAPKFNCPQQALLDPVTVYGISKQAGEQWCAWYHRRYGVDVRSLRYPGLISYLAAPGGGTTDYAVEIFHSALRQKKYTCFLRPETCLPMMYMPDAIRATMELMETPVNTIRVRHSYNIAAMSFSPEMIAVEIKKIIPEFKINYEPDYRQSIAESWPGSIDDSAAQADWGWAPDHDLPRMVRDMIRLLQKKFLSDVSEIRL